MKLFSQPTGKCGVYSGHLTGNRTEVCMGGANYLVRFIKGARSVGNSVALSNQNNICRVSITIGYAS